MRKHHPAVLPDGVMIVPDYTGMMPDQAKFIRSFDSGTHTFMENRAIVNLPHWHDSKKTATSCPASDISDGAQAARASAFSGASAATSWFSTAASSGSRQYTTTDRLCRSIPRTCGGSW